MILPSYSFIFIFLPIVVVGYFLLNKVNHTFGKVLLLAASVLYYGLMGWKSLLALVLSMAVNYIIATYLFVKITRDRVKKLILALGILIDIGALMYCKYLLYFESVFNKLFKTELTFTAIILPIGISYFTFSQIAYLVDSYKNPEMKVSVLDYALFVTFFPKITVGPIALSTEMIPIFNDENRKKVDYDNIAKGMYGFVLGLSKKLLLADNLGKFVDLGYSNISALGTTNAIIVILSYTMQIYFDFSGYCDMAIGISRMLNIDLADNFDAPYRALSIAEFWKRWHITLTRFFRNYLYIPMGGNRKGKIRTYFNNFFIFFISGLWHGAGTNFLVWGSLHGVGSIFSKIASPVMKKLPKAVRWLLTFVFVSLAWVFFRAPDVTTANLMFKELFSGRFIAVDINIAANAIPTEGRLIQWFAVKYAPNMTYYTGCAIILILLALSLYLGTFAKTCRERVASFKPSGAKIASTVILFVWSVLSLSEIAKFIYVNF